MEGKKLKYPRKRVITVSSWRDAEAPDCKPLVDFAEKYKRGPNSKVVVKHHEDPSFIRFGARIPRTSIIFYSYEPVGILRENCIEVLNNNYLTGFFSIDGYLLWRE